MSRMPAWLKRYQALPKEVYLLATGQVLINLIQSTYLLLLNLFLKQGGLDDPTIAALGSKRFIATFLLAIPGGLWLRGKPLRWPLFYASLLFPITALLGLEAARNGHLTAAGLAFVVMGAAGLVLGIASLPMMMRLAPEEQKSEALSLQFATWAAASICGGLLASGLQALGTVEVGSWKFTLDAHATLLLLTLAGFAAPLVFWRLKEPALPPPRQTHWLHVHREDFGILFRALVPSTCIAIGAGLSIQFMNLFFSHIFGISASAYSAYVTISNVLVLIASLILPEVRRRLGWRGAILGVQCTAVILLAAMGMTELVHTMAWAAPLAIVLFILRQPLMSMAGPAVNELTMLYVGTRNHELVSACNGAIWSGSWWVAAVIFQHLRAANVAYWQIFCATSILYFFGSFSYLGIIRTTERKANDTPVSTPEQKEFPA